MCDFDQAARYAAKQLDPPGLFRWMLGPGIWKTGLEGDTVQRASIVLEWEARGALKTTRAYLLRALELRFKTAVPPEMRQAVQAQPDQETLDCWFDLALTADSLDQVRAAFGANGP